MVTNPGCYDMAKWEMVWTVRGSRDCHPHVQAERRALVQGQNRQETKEPANLHLPPCGLQRVMERFR